MYYIINILDGDNSVLKLLEKSIEPVDETSFVSSILNSGKVIQLTGIIFKFVLLFKQKINYVVFLFYF